MINAPAELTSGEGVQFELNHAGVGSRLVAAFVDLVIQFVSLFILIALTGEIAGSADSAAVSALVIVEVVLVFAGYPILMEWLTHGRTVGKMWLGLRAVRDDGGPIGFRQALVRGLSGLLIEKPGLLVPLSTAVAVMTMIFSRQNKRIGDMMAGTFVLNERAGPRWMLVARDYTVPYQLQPWMAALDLSRLDDHLALCVRQFVVRARDMTPAAQHSLGEDLRARVESVTSPPAPPDTPTPWILTTVLAERRRRAEMAAASSHQPPYPAHYQPTHYQPTQYQPTPYPTAHQPPYAAPPPAYRQPYAPQPPPDAASPSPPDRPSERPDPASPWERPDAATPWDRPDAPQSPFVPPN